jgi:hypothetical protein
MARLLSVLFLCCLYSGYSAAVDDTRMARPYGIHKFENAGLVVAVPGYPTWEYKLQRRKSTDAVTLLSPAQYYPVTHMQIQLHPDLQVDPLGLDKAALSSANEIRNQLNLPRLESIDALTYVEYRDVRGYADVLDKEQGGQSL